MADLINRDHAAQAIEAYLCNQCDHDTDLDPECIACPHLDGAKILKSVPAVNRWIPCSERMPENNVPVLYVWRSQNGAVAVLHGWHFEIRSLGSAWHQSGNGLHRPDEEVTHWMPLPEPPEGGD